MKVLHIQRASGVAGSERHLLELLPALRLRGVDAQMCVLLTGNGEEFVDAMRNREVPVHVVNAGGHVAPDLIFRLWRLIRRVRPDLVHTHLIDADLYGQTAARLAGVPAISSVHGTPSGWERGMLRRLCRVVGRLPVRRIAISWHVREFLVANRLTPADRIVVIHYGIDASQWSATNSQRTTGRAALGIDEQTVAVGIASRLIPGKGHSTLFRAARLAGAQLATLEILVAGEGALRAELEHGLSLPPTSPTDPPVRFLGFVKDVRAFMHACDIVVFPTEPPLSEGFGLAALEALAVGRPVVASDWSALPEVVSNEDSGLLFPPGSATDLADALVRLASNPSLRHTFGRQAAERARSTFPIDKMVAATLDVYRTAVDCAGDPITGRRTIGSTLSGP